VCADKVRNIFFQSKQREKKTSRLLQYVF
jgi:hypothetical protein